jgi:hypothetical protein
MIAVTGVIIVIAATKDREAGGSIVTVHAVAHSSMTCEIQRRRFRAELQPQ